MGLGCGSRPTWLGSGLCPTLPALGGSTGAPCAVREFRPHFRTGRAAAAPFQPVLPGSGRWYVARGRVWGHVCTHCAGREAVWPAYAQEPVFIAPPEWSTRAWLLSLRWYSAGSWQESPPTVRGRGPRQRRTACRGAEPGGPALRPQRAPPSPLAVGAAPPLLHPLIGCWGGWGRPASGCSSGESTLGRRTETAAAPSAKGRPWCVCPRPAGPEVRTASSGRAQRRGACPSASWGGLSLTGGSLGTRAWWRALEPCPSQVTLCFRKPGPWRPRRPPVF